MTSQALTQALFDGNPAMQIVGAAVPTALDLAVQAGAVVRTKIVNWMDRIVTVAAWDATTTREQFIQQLTATEAGPSLYYRVMIAAGSSRLEDKVRGFAYALQLGVTQPERLDEAYLLVEVLEAIELPHMEIMRLIRQHELAHEAESTALPDDAREMRKLETGAIESTDLDTLMPHYSHVRHALASRLLQLGLIKNSALGNFYGSGGERFNITELGLSCLDLIDGEPTATAAPQP